MKNLSFVAQQKHDSYECELKNIEIRNLGRNELLIQNSYSSLNYKDALAVTGKGRILRSLPLVPGIDFAGKVVQSNHAGFEVGEEVLATGCGHGETRSGGFGKYVITSPEAAIKIPAALCAKTAMIYGTAGFTAALAIQRMIQNGQNPDQGPIVVTGASGGVGSFGIYFLQQSGFTPWAITSKEKNHSLLAELGAQKCLPTSDFLLDSKPLEKITMGGAIDNLGGQVLSKCVASTALWGNVASIGLASSSKIRGTVMPHILRGVSLLGISSANCPRHLREEVWKFIAAHHSTEALKLIHQKTIPLNELTATSEALLSNKLSGRVLVKVN